MAWELLIRNVDKGTERLRGHVIAACEAPHEWGREEIANPEWTIVVADITEVEAHALLAPGDGGGFRLLRVDLDGWSGGVMSRADLTARVY